MAVYDLQIFRDRPLVIGARGISALLQNVRIIVLTTVYSIPLDRAFAHKAEMVDSPAPVITTRMTADLIEAIEKYEPRIRVEKLVFEKAAHGRGVLMEGRLTPRVTFSLREGVEL